MSEENVTRNEYLACRERCNDRCENCREEHSELRHKIEKIEDDVDVRTKTTMVSLSELRTEITVQNLKWAFMSFIGSFVAGILTILIGAFLVMHFGLAAPAPAPEPDKVTQKPQITIGISAAQAAEIERNQ